MTNGPYVVSEDCLVFAKNIEEENERLLAENEKFCKQAEMNARLLTENASLRGEVEKLRRDVKTAVMGDSAELQDVKRENDKLRAALAPFAAYIEQPTQIYEHDGVRMTLVNQDVLMRLCQAAAAAIRESGE